jgi:hypothetical protein
VSTSSALTSSPETPSTRGKPSSKHSGANSRQQSATKLTTRIQPSLQFGPGKQRQFNATQTTRQARSRNWHGKIRVPSVSHSPPLHITHLHPLHRQAIITPPQWLSMHAPFHLPSSHPRIAKASWPKKRASAAERRATLHATAPASPTSALTTAASTLWPSLPASAHWKGRRRIKSHWLWVFERLSRHVVDTSLGLYCYTYL